jgi:hypothetical protein
MLGVQCSVHVCQMVWHVSAAVYVLQDKWLPAVTLKSVMWREPSTSKKLVFPPGCHTISCVLMAPMPFTQLFDGCVAVVLYSHRLCTSGELSALLGARITFLGVCMAVCRVANVAVDQPNTCHDSAAFLLVFWATCLVWIVDVHWQVTCCRVHATGRTTSVLFCDQQHVNKVASEPLSSS